MIYLLSWLWINGLLSVTIADKVRLTPPDLLKLREDDWIDGYWIDCDWIDGY